MLVPDYHLHDLLKESIDNKVIHLKRLAQQIKIINITLWILVSNIWGGKGEELSGDFEILGAEGFSISAFHPEDVLVGPSRVRIRTTMAAIVPTVKDQVIKLFNTTASIAIIKNAMLGDKKSPPTGIHIHSLWPATIIL